MSDGINKKDTRTDNPFANQPVAIQLFPELIAPNGFLSPTRESMACWYYYVLARRNWEECKDALFIEGHDDPSFNFRQLFTSIAKIYGVEPEGMAKCWKGVDLTAFALGLPQLPDEERYRFDRVEVITTGNRSDNPDSDEIAALADERIWLCKIEHGCPACKSYQIQLLDVKYQEWKCRMCKQVFKTNFTDVDAPADD